MSSTSPSAMSGMAAMMNPSAMVEIFKMQLVMNLVSSLGSTDDKNGVDWWALSHKLLQLCIILSIDALSKGMSSMLAWLRAHSSVAGMLAWLQSDTYNVVTPSASTSEAYKAAENTLLARFKCTMWIPNQTYKLLVMNEIMAKHKLDNRFVSKIITAQVTDLYFSSEKLEGAEQHLLIGEANQAIRVERLGWGQWIYLVYTVNTLGSGEVTLACNTKTSDLIDYLNRLESRHKLAMSRRFVPTCTNIRYVGSEIKSDTKAMSTEITFDNTFFEHREDVLKILTQFKDKEWYQRKALPHHLSMLLHGPPGTSKTSCIKAMARFMRMNICSVSCAGIKTKTQFDKIVSHATAQSILVLEEFDRIESVLSSSSSSPKNGKDAKSSGTRGGSDDGSSSSGSGSGSDTKSTDASDDSPKEVMKRMQNAYSKSTDAKEKDRLWSIIKKMEEEDVVSNGDALDLAHILNYLDGIADHPGRILIFTANHPERIEPAILRGGRMDHIFHFRQMTRKVLGQILQHFFVTSELPTSSSSSSSSSSPSLTSMSSSSSSSSSSSDREKKVGPPPPPRIPSLLRVEEHRYTHDQVYGLIKKYNEVRTIVKMLESGKIDLQARVWETRSSLSSSSSQ